MTDLRSVYRWSALVPLLVGAACVGDDAGARTVTTRDSAGVRIVEITGAAGEEPLTPMHVTDLAPPDEVLSATPWGVATDPSNGRIYVADRLSDRVVTFDASGAFAGVLGRSGAGPGEFRSPSALYLGTDQVLRVWDTGRGVISRWSADGEFLGEDQPEGQYWGPGFVAEADRLVTVTNVQTEGEMGMNQRLEVYRDGGRATLHELHLPMQMIELPCMTRPGPTVLAPSLTWSSRGNRTFIQRYPDYRIDVFEDTTLVSSIRQSVPPIPVTEEMAAEAVEFGPTPYQALLRMCDVTPAQVVRAVGYEEQTSPILALAVGPEERLWVTRTRDGISPSSIDVLGPDGTFQFAVDVPAAVVGFPSSSTFLALRLDRETGQPLLSLYSLDGTTVARRDPAGGGSSGPAETAGRASVETSEGDWTPPPPDWDLEPGDEFRDCAACPLMVVIPPGRYVMGSPDDEAHDEVAERWHHLLVDEHPQVEVEIDYPLAVGKFELTFDEWERCREAEGCTLAPDDEGNGEGDRPVINLGRGDAQEYLAWLSEETGAVYRLPSEAEWEYAARAGSTTARYWGDEIGEEQAACNGCGGRWNGRSSAPVGSFSANGFGLHDVLGNAEEWTSDCYYRGNDAGPNDGGPVLEASPYWEDGTCTVYVLRGGGWRSEPWKLRAAARDPYNTEGPWGLSGSASSGLRVFRELDISTQEGSEPPTSSTPDEGRR